MVKLKIPIFVILIFLSYFFLQVLLNYKNQIPLSTSEAEIYLLSKTAIFGNPDIKKTALEFAGNNGYIFSSIPILYLVPFTLFSPVIYLTRIPQLIAGFILCITLYLLIKKLVNYFFKGDKFLFILPILIILSPWLQSLILFHLPETLTFIFFALFLYLILEIMSQINIIFWILFTFLLFIISLSSLSGFWLSIFMPIVFVGYCNKYIKKKYYFILFLAVYSFFAIIFYKNSNFLLSFIKENSLVGQLTPKRLANEIDERQKIDYLASGKKFILPSIVRKFIYNKPYLAFDKVYKNFVSYFDFEQYAFPLISYDEVRLSGLLPKGNLPLGFFWDIPLICLGIYLIYFNKNKFGKIFFYFIPLSFIPTFMVFKRNILTSGFSLILFIFFFQYVGVRQLLVGFNNKLRIPFKSFIFISALILTFGIYEQNKLIYKDIFAYQTSHLYFYREISRFVSENRDAYSNFIITNRFGPTYLMTSFYLNIKPDDYWAAFRSSDNISYKINNLEFRNINFSEEGTKEKYIYLGLPGEFTKPGNNTNVNPLPANLSLIDEIKAPDELVWQYGQNLWIISEKK